MVEYSLVRRSVQSVRGKLSAISKHFQNASGEEISTFIRSSLNEIKGRVDNAVYEETSISPTSGDSILPNPLLSNVPIMVKGNICVRDSWTSCASGMLPSFLPPYDATCIYNLRLHGAKIVGRTNMDEFGMGSHTSHSIHGRCRWREREREEGGKTTWETVGGSSGGSAAVVAEGVVPIALGSDTGGSVRQPAAFCGVVGFKPTYGRISRHGLISYASSLDSIGILSQRVYDSALALDSLSGIHVNPTSPERIRTSDMTMAPFSPTQCATTVAEIDASRTGRSHNLRLGIFADWEKDADSQLTRMIRSVAEKVQSFNEGSKVASLSLPHSRLLPEIYYVISTAEASSNLARYDGLRFGGKELEWESSSTSHQDSEDSVNPQTLTGHYQAMRSKGFGEEVQRRIMTGTKTLSVGEYDLWFKGAQRLRGEVCDGINNIFFGEGHETADVIIAPVVDGGAVDDSDVVKVWQSDRYTVLSNLSGCPSISLPLHSLSAVDADGGKHTLPASVQLIGKPWHENEVLRVARIIEMLDDEGEIG